MDYPIHIYDTATVGKPVICLAHGNGFPPEMYIPLIRAIGSDYHSVCLPSRPWWENSDPDAFTGWEMLADDLIAGIKAHDLAPVIGIGHSMGGVAMMIAAVRQPELFHSVIMLDPVFMPRFWLRFIRIAKPFGYRPLKQLINRALKRQRQWNSLEDAYQRFRQRSLFARCSDEVVCLYVEGMTRPSENGIALAYLPEWEAAIFSHIPLYEWRYPPKLTVPALIIGGAKSDTFLSPAIKLWRRMRPDIRVEIISESGHLVPMEEPDTVAGYICAFLNQSADKRRGRFSATRRHDTFAHS